jgi:hypothetical protein
VGLTVVQIPPVKNTDAEDVAWGLQTADSLWRRGEKTDALVWLRRAAQAAGDANDDDRALELARYAAELTESMNVVPAYSADETLVEAVIDAGDEEIVVDAAGSDANVVGVAEGGSRFQLDYDEEEEFTVERYPSRQPVPAAAPAEAQAEYSESEEEVVGGEDVADDESGPHVAAEPPKPPEFRMPSQPTIELSDAMAEAARAFAAIASDKMPAAPITAPLLDGRDDSVSVLPAEKVHEGMFDPWADQASAPAAIAPAREAPARPSPSRAPAPAAPAAVTAVAISSAGGDDEVFTSVQPQGMPRASSEAPPAAAPGPVIVGKPSVPAKPVKPPPPLPPRARPGMSKPAPPVQAPAPVPVEVEEMEAEELELEDVEPSLSSIPPPMESGASQAPLSLDPLSVEPARPLQPPPARAKVPPPPGRPVRSVPPAPARSAPPTPQRLAAAAPVGEAAGAGGDGGLETSADALAEALRAAQAARKAAAKGAPVAPRARQAPSAPAVPAAPVAQAVSEEPPGEVGAAAYDQAGAAALQEQAEAAPATSEQAEGAYATTEHAAPEHVDANPADVAAEHAHAEHAQAHAHAEHADVDAEHAHAEHAHAEHADVDAEHAHAEHADAGRVRAVAAEDSQRAFEREAEDALDALELGGPLVAAEEVQASAAPLDEGTVRELAQTDESPAPRSVLEGVGSIDRGGLEELESELGHGLDSVLRDVAVVVPEEDRLALEPEPVADDGAPAPERLELDDVEAFSDLPDDARAAFAEAATIHSLAQGEEIGTFALAYVLSGSVDVAATVVDAPAVRLAKGAVLRARGTTEEGVPMRLICASGRTVLATWSDAAVDEAFRSIPWVEEDLRAMADRVQTLVGITIGPLGERLDMSIREQIVSRLTMRTLIPAEVVVQAGEPVPGLLLVGIGELELVKDDKVIGVVSSGDFLFPTEVLGAGSAPATARAGAGGALVMFGDRGIAQELLVTCPPLLEVFAGM